MKRSVHAKRMAKHHRRGSGVPKLNLVSLMDIFTIMVFFLLVNSSNVEVLESNKSIKLPDSTVQKKPDETLVVMISKTDIIVNGQAIIPVNVVIQNSSEEVVALRKELEYQASKAPYRTPEEQEEGRYVTIMGDATLPYKLLKKIMTTCAKSEYRNISLAVNQVSAKDPKADPEGS